MTENKRSWWNMYKEQEKKSRTIVPEKREQYIIEKLILEQRNKDIM